MGIPGRPRDRGTAVLAALRSAGPRQYAAIVAGVGAVATVRARKRIGLGSGPATACAFALPLSVAAGFERSRVRDGGVWAAQMWAYKNAFEMPADDEQRLRRRAHFDYPIAVDRIIGAGTPPSQRLARLLRRRGHLSALDKALTFFYWTWEAEPHLAMGWIRLRRPEHFASAAGRLAATFDLTLLGYWIVPSAPPWWVSEKLGRMNGEVRRVMAEVADWVKQKPNPTEGEHEMGANPFAAMPSDHFASAAMTAILLTEQDRRLGLFAWSYTLGLGFVLVYLGEHYVVDLLAGLALALGVNAARQGLECVAERVLALGPGR
ncbi:MAG TPA: phosphatase PAP2 family protein [Solirubrobacteraceae bacterium]|nr:phosphatase PAP2 family protein [Solirubrobacteraceae bacterium]